jgi:hypothetical protein
LINPPINQLREDVLAFPALPRCKIRVLIKAKLKTLGA